MTDLMQAVRRRWMIFFGIILVSTLIGGWIGYTIPRTYEAKTDLLVNSMGKVEENSAPTMGEIETNLRLIETYTDIFTSNRLVSEVKIVLGDSYTKPEVAKKVKLETGNGSQIITIITRDSTPEKAAKLANTYALTFQEEIQTLMNLDNITILKEVIVGTDTKMIKPFTFYYLIVSLGIGFLISIAVVLIGEVYFARLNTERKVEKSLGIPFLGSILMKKEKNSNSHYYNGDFESVTPRVQFPNAEKEDFNKLAATIHYLKKQKKVKTIMITSSGAGEGKTFIGSNLAVKLAMDGQKTLFIDADLRKSDGRLLFNLPERKGLTSVISGFYELDTIIQETGIENLSFIGTGPLPLNPVKFIIADGMEKLLDDIKVLFDVVIIDSPPLTVADGISLIQAVDGCIYVTHVKKTTEVNALKYLEYLKNVNATLLGAVLNGSRKGINRHS